MRRVIRSSRYERAAARLLPVKPRRSTDGPLGQRLLDSMQELRAHLRGESFSVRSVQDWEQGRRRPEIPIRAYLAVIQRDPEAVIRALRAA